MAGPGALQFGLPQFGSTPALPVAVVGAAVGAAFAAWVGTTVGDGAVVDVADAAADVVVGVTDDEADDAVAAVVGVGGIVVAVGAVVAVAVGCATATCVGCAVAWTATVGVTGREVCHWRINATTSLICAGERTAPQVGIPLAGRPFAIVWRNQLSSNLVSKSCELSAGAFFVP